MKKIWVLLFLMSQPAWATDYVVTRSTDVSEEGELRVVLQHACDNPGDDQVRFEETRLSDIRISLEAPLVIPADCQGRIDVEGSAEVDTLLDATTLDEGGNTPGDSCTLHIYSDRHTVKNFSFVKNSKGAGACLFGRENRIEANRFGRGQSGAEESNRYGIVISNIFAQDSPAIDGRGNLILLNQIGPSDEDGIWGHADQATIQENEIENSQGRGIVLYGHNHRIDRNQVHGNSGHGLRLEGNQIEVIGNQIEGNSGHGIWIRSEGSRIVGNQIVRNGNCIRSSSTKSCKNDKERSGAGILIADQSFGITVGGESVSEQGNIIQYNQAGGVLILGDETSEHHTITHNILSRNYGKNGSSLDLDDDGLTLNDWEDADEGPNHLLNFLTHFQAFPLVPSSSGADRYWGWGIDQVGERVELYAAAEEDISRRVTHGGGDSFLADLAVQDWSFEVSPGALTTGQWTSSLTFNTEGDTSEFSINLPVNQDDDLDGIINLFETGDGVTPLIGSGPRDTDSDDDSLPDPVEDKNRNGDQELTEGETAADNPDSDGDLLGDFSEVHGDGVYDLSRDTDPLNPDTDGDGLLDGEEDANGDGIWDAYLGESSPRLVDSDADGIADGLDSCPSIFNPGQETWYCEL